MELKRFRVSLRGRFPRASPVTAAAAVPAAVCAAPLRALRSGSGTLNGVVHCGAYPLHQVRVMLAGAGVFLQSLPVSLKPGERLRFRVGTAPPEVAAAQTVVVRWLEPNGAEFLWSAPVH